MKKLTCFVILVAYMTACGPTANTPRSTDRDYSDYQNMVGVLRTIGGLQIVGNGDPQTKIYIRGTGTIELDAQPLFVVDNIPLGRGYSVVHDLAPVDVAKIDVLRGLTATTRWGEQGNHGVIMIRTKRIR